MMTQQVEGVTTVQRRAPWDTIGGFSDTVMTAIEAAERGGIDFTVSFYPVEYTSALHGHRVVGARQVVERDDTGDALGIVSETYKALQYGEAFDFMDGISPEYVAASTLRGGRQAFIVAKPPTSWHLELLDGADPHNMFIVLRTSHDCTRAVEVSVVALRVRCTNQLTLRGFATNAHWRWSVTHVGDVRAKLAAAEETLARFEVYVKEYARTVERLAAKKISLEVGREILRKVLPDRPQRDATVDRIIDLWQTSAFVGFEDNGWGLVNALSEHQDWRRAHGSPASRFLGALEGQTHKVINKAATLVLSRA